MGAWIIVFLHCKCPLHVFFESKMTIWHSMTLLHRGFTKSSNNTVWSISYTCIMYIVCVFRNNYFIILTQAASTSCINSPTNVYNCCIWNLKIINPWSNKLITIFHLHLKVYSFIINSLAKVVNNFMTKFHPYQDDNLLVVWCIWLLHLRWND